MDNQQSQGLGASQGQWLDAAGTGLAAAYRTAPSVATTPRATDGFEERGSEPQLEALYAALAKASGEFSEIAKSEHVKITLKSGGNYEYDYAPLKSLIDATRPALSRCGVFVSFPPSLKADENGVCRLRLMITGHGARLIFTHEFFKAQDIKDYGGQLTYLSRYMFRGCLGLDAGDLDADEVPREREDGARAESTPKQRQAPTPQSAPRPAQAKPPQASKPAETTRPQEAPKPAPQPTQRPASQPPPPPAAAPAPAQSKPEPSNSELAQGLGLPIETSAEPKVEREDDGDPVAMVRAMSPQALEDAIRVNGRAIGISKAGVAQLYQEVSKNPETTMQTASRTHHEAALLELMRRRREAEAQGA